MVHDGLRHGNLIVAQHALTHQAVLELAADGVGRVEQALHALDQTGVGRRVDGGVARVHGDSVLVQLLLGLKQDKRGAGGRARRADRAVDALVGVRHIVIDAAGELRNTRLQHTFCEVVQLHRQFCRREVDADVLLRRHRQGRVLFVVVLHLKGSAVSHQRAIRQADAEGGADLGAFDGKAVVVLAVDVAGQHQVVLEDLQGLPGDHVDSKNAIGHGCLLGAISGG